MKGLNNWFKARKEKKAAERLIGYKLTDWELSMLREAKEKDSHLTGNSREFSDRLVNEIIERKRICSVYISEKPNKRDLGLGIGLGIGIGIVLGVYWEFSEAIYEHTFPDYVCRGFLVVAFFCFCIIMGLTFHNGHKEDRV